MDNRISPMVLNEDWKNHTEVDEETISDTDDDNWIYLTMIFWKNGERLFMREVRNFKDCYQSSKLSWKKSRKNKPPCRIANSDKNTSGCKIMVTKLGNLLRYSCCLYSKISVERLV